jgi:hypothetical protein
MKQASSSRRSLPLWIGGLCFSTLVVAGAPSWSTDGWAETPPIAKICVHGTATKEGEKLAAGDRLRVVAVPFGCYSSSCTFVDIAECSVRADGRDLMVEGDFLLTGLNGDRLCSPDCGGGGSASCGDEITLEAGEYAVHSGELRVVINVPSVLPRGGACDGDPLDRE